MIDAETGTSPVRELVKEKSVTMEYFLETSHLDATTAEMLKKYDKDGNGSFSKDEVVAIVLDLREAMQSNELLGASNKMFKRLFLLATTFSLLLLTSIFGLSYAVAALTRNTDVNDSGTMFTRDGAHVIATDSTATSYSVGPDETGNYCIPANEGIEIYTAASEGRNVLMKIGGYNGDQNLSHTITAGANGMEEDANGYCIWNEQEQRHECLTWKPDETCVPHDATGRRKLVERDLELLITNESVNADPSLAPCHSDCPVSDPPVPVNYICLLCLNGYGQLSYSGVSGMFVFEPNGRR